MSVILRYKNELQSNFLNVDKHVAEICKIISTSIPNAPDKLMFLVEYSLRELINNAIEHGNKMELQKLVSIDFKATENFVEVDIFDEGDGFDIEEFLRSKELFDVIRSRKRGIKTLLDMGFKIKTSKGCVNAMLPISQFLKSNEDTSREMLLSTIEGSSTLKISVNLLGTNIQEISDKVKTDIKHKNDFEVLTLDLSDVKSIDSMGISFLIELYKIVSAKNKKIRVIGASEQMKDLFGVMKLEMFFEIV